MCVLQKTESSFVLDLRLERRKPLMGGYIRDLWVNNLRSCWTLIVASLIVDTQL